MKPEKNVFPIFFLSNETLPSEPFDEECVGKEIEMQMKDEIKSDSWSLKSRLQIFEPALDGISVEVQTNFVDDENDTKSQDSGVDLIGAIIFCM